MATTLYIVGVKNSGKTSFLQTISGSAEPKQVHPHISVTDFEIDGHFFHAFDFKNDPNTLDQMLDDNGIYVVVMDFSEWRDWDLHRWLFVIRNRSKSAPILLVGTHAEQCTKRQSDEREAYCNRARICRGISLCPSDEENKPKMKSSDMIFAVSSKWTRDAPVFARLKETLVKLTRPLPTLHFKLIRGCLPIIERTPEEQSRWYADLHSLNPKGSDHSYVQCYQSLQYTVQPYEPLAYEDKVMRLMSSFPGFHRYHCSACRFEVNGQTVMLDFIASTIKFYFSFTTPAEMIKLTQILVNHLDSSQNIQARCEFYSFNHTRKVWLGCVKCLGNTVEITDLNDEECYVCKKKRHDGEDGCESD